MNRIALLTVAYLFVIAPFTLQAENTPLVFEGVPVKCGTADMLKNPALKTANIAGYTNYRSTGMEHNILSSGGNFRVHYNTTGDDAVPTDDTDSNGVPDYIDSTLVYLEYAYDLLMDIGFGPPLADDEDIYGINGGGDETDLYFVDMASDNGGYFGLTSTEDENWSEHTSSAYMEIENDFAEQVFASRGLTPLQALQVTTAHEFFHVVQFRYNFDHSINWWQEQSAVWMEEYAWDEVNDYHSYLKFFFNDYITSMSYSPREKPLDTINGAYEYGAGVFAMFLAKTYGPGMIKDLWEHMGNQNSSRIAEFNAVIPGGLPNALAEFATWNYFTADRGNDIDFYQDSTDFPMKISMDGTTSKITDSGSFTTNRLTSKYQEIILNGEFTESDYLRVTFNSSDGAFGNSVVLYNSPTDYRIFPFSGQSKDIPLAGSWKNAVLISACANTTGSSFSYTYQTGVITHVEDDSPLVFALAGTYPNPFNPSTTVAFTVPDGGGMVTARAYNALGQEVATLFDGHLASGEKHVVWKPDQSLAGGMYFIRVAGPWGVETAKTLFLK